MLKQQKDAPLVFIDDAHTFGGTQIALAWTIRVVLLATNLPVLCICTAKTRSAVESIVGPHPLLRFERAPSALPLNIASFPIRLPAYWSLLRRIRRSGVRGWWLNLADIEFGLAPLLVLRAMGEDTHTYLHGTGRFTLFHQAAGWRRRLLSSIRDFAANKFVFRLHSCLITASQSSQAEVQSRITSAKKPFVDYLYYPSIGVHAGQVHEPVPSIRSIPLQLWMIGNVIQGHKNNLVAIDVLEQLVRQGHSATLTIAGVGPDLQSFQHEAIRRGLNDRITYLGWVTDPCALVPKQAIVFIPSFHETMNLVAREAMRYGLRLVASPIPVFHEWIPAALIALDFSPEAFTTCILDVNRISADELAAAYQLALARFTDDIFLGKLLRFTNISSQDS